jgi:hypothetical protein
LKEPEGDEMTMSRSVPVSMIWIFPVGTTKPGELDWVHGIAVDAHGDGYVGDIRGRRVQKFAFEAAAHPLRPAGSR